MARAVDSNTLLRCKLSELQQREVVRRYSDGESGPQIASTMNCGPDLIYKVLDHHGVDRDSTGERNRSIDDDAIDAIIDGYLSGKSQTALAQELGVSQSHISNTLRKSGVPTRRQPRTFSKTEVDDIRRRYEAGESAGAIAESFGVFHTRVLVELRRSGVKTRRRPGFHTWTDRQGRQFTFKSLWELRVAQHFDLLGKHWDYEREAYVVVLDDGTATYTPDFWVYDTKGRLEAVVDVKGRWWPDGQQEKIALFREQYSDIPFEIWDAGVLRGSGVRLL